MLFEWTEHPSWEIRGTGLTHYIEHANVVWVIRTSLLRNQDLDSQPILEMQRLFQWSGHLSWEIRGTGLTHYIGTCKSCLSGQDISPEKLEALDSLPILNMQMLFEWSGQFSWENRGTGLTNYVKAYKCCLSDQDIPPEKPEALDSPPMLEHAKVVWVIKTSILGN
jgi:hypothetical protein